MKCVMNSVYTGQIYADRRTTKQGTTENLAHTSTEVDK
jgi:hypothetical protein